MADIELELEESQLINLGRILLGAGYADGEFHGLEREAIQDALSDVIHDFALADRVISELNDFDPDTFDVEAAVDGLGDLDSDATTAVMTMVARVTDADFTHDFAESDYVQKVAELLGAEPDSYDEHVVELVEE